MKASRAQSQLIKQNTQILVLLQLIAKEVGIEEQGILLSLDTQETIAPTKREKRTRAEVAQDQADKAEKEQTKSMPDSRNMSQSVPQDDSDGTDSAEPNPLPTID